MVSTLSLPVMYLILCNNKFVFLTPIRQGNIYIMHQMMQYGADLRLIDLQGKTSMHHAVTGGNMWVKGTARHNKFFFFFFLGLAFVWLHSHKYIWSWLSFPVLQCTICGRQECFASQTQTCTECHRFTWRHPQATQRWSGICSDTRCDSLRSLTFLKF